MQLKRLKELIPDKDIDGLWATYQKAHPDGDVSTFAADLSKQGMLTAGQLRELLVGQDVSFTISEAIGAAKTGAVSSSAYRLLGMLGKGAMGEVHIARDTDLHRNVAVKLMDPGLAKDPTLVRRFLTEVQVTAQLDHPAIVPVYGLERRPDGAIGYSMRIIRGDTLEQFIKDTRAFYDKGVKPDERHALTNRLSVFIEICQAMHYAHVRGVIHRDLKPENIMIGNFGEVMVMDWGIARLVGGSDDPQGGVQGQPDATGGTMLGTAIGTPPYMSPEQAQGKNAELDGRSDQYALGLILYELVALKRAVTGKNVATVITRAADADRDEFVHRFGEAIPRELHGIVAKATAPRPKDRYPDVEALVTDVRRYLRDESVEAAPDRGLQRVKRWVGKNRGLALSIIAGVGALGLFGVGGSLLLGVTGLAVSEYMAEQREERLGHVISAVGAQSHRIDATLQRYGGLLSVLQGAAEYALQDTVVEPRTVYLAADYASPSTAPPDLRPSKVYDGPASAGFTDSAVAVGVDRAAVEPRLQQLAALVPTMKLLVVRSQGEDAVSRDGAAQDALILDQGAPMVWNYVAVEEGVLTGFPGTGDYPADYDPRTMAWYTRTKGTRGLQWDANDDESGQGMLITASTALYDVSGRFLGVAAVDVTARYVAENLLLPEGVAGVDVALVDENGLIIAGTEVPIDASSKPPYRHPEVAQEVASGRASGHLELSGERGAELVVWSRLQVVPWTYVVAGPSAELLGGW